jgi:hypothetical protein
MKKSKIVALMYSGAKGTMVLLANEKQVFINPNKGLDSQVKEGNICYYKERKAGETYTDKEGKEQKTKKDFIEVIGVGAEKLTDVERFELAKELGVTVNMG